MSVSEDRIREIVQEELRNYRIQRALSWLSPEKVIKLFNESDAELKEIYRPYAEAAQEVINARPKKPEGFWNRLFKG